MYHVREPIAFSDYQATYSYSRIFKMQLGRGGEHFYSRDSNEAIYLHMQVYLAIRCEYISMMANR